MSMQTFDEGTLTTIRRKNIKVEKYHELSGEFRRNDLPMMVDIMMGLPGSTPETFRNDLQECLSRTVRVAIHSTMLLTNSPMNEPDYRQENGIVALPGRGGEGDQHVHPGRLGADEPADLRLLRVRELRRAAPGGHLRPRRDRSSARSTSTSAS